MLLLSMRARCQWLFARLELVISVLLPSTTAHECEAPGRPDPSLEVRVLPIFAKGRFCYRLWRIESQRLWQPFSFLKPLN